MKKFFLVLSYLFVASVLTLAVFGQAKAGTVSTAGSQSGAAIYQDFGHNAASAPVDLSRSVGTAIAPAIPGSLITCQGGVSFSTGFAGGSIALGKSIESDPCNLRQNAMAYLNCHGDSGCVAIMCNDPIVKASLLLTETPCPQSNPSVNAAQIKERSQKRQLDLQAQFDKRYGVR
jgi:hypothetical protein